MVTPCLSASGRSVSVAFSAARAEEGIRSLGDEIVQLDVEGLEAWALAADADAIATAEPSRSVPLLPAFDQYMVGSTKHSAI